MASSAPPAGSAVNSGGGDQQAIHSSGTSTPTVSGQANGYWLFFLLISTIRAMTVFFCFIAALQPVFKEKVQSRQD